MRAASERAGAVCTGVRVWRVCACGVFGDSGRPTPGPGFQSANVRWPHSAPPTARCRAVGPRGSPPPRGQQRPLRPGTGDRRSKASGGRAGALRGRGEPTRRLAVGHVCTVPRSRPARQAVASKSEGAVAFTQLSPPSAALGVFRLQHATRVLGSLILSTSGQFRPRIILRRKCPRGEL